ncbi:hypothetical protein RN001_010615 [Aquatica leii]|uniref:BPL/LPL catalytic domain-containing protein n=1 Tax=Aquatica leii TaxID=1421715 RepID=A0AAN7P6R2_9COLE|nr:hypothetical protein RN001_010615 [Aquatica leii]
MQWWRLGSLRNKLSGTLNSHNALMVCVGSTISDSKNQRCLENLLFHNEDRIGCTVVPKQQVDLSQWALFPKDLNYFPMFISDSKTVLATPKIYLLVQAKLDDYNQHDSEIIQIENFGELVAWRAQDQFEMILKTDMTNLTKFVNCFFDHSIDINHELKLLRIETVNVEGNPVRIKYDLRYPLENRLKYSLAPIHWKKFATELKSLYSKLHKLEHPTITIESSTSKAVPISEVKPIKKPLEPTKHHHRMVKKENKNKLEVSTLDARRPKSGERKPKLEKTKHRHPSREKKEESVSKKIKAPKLAKCGNNEKHRECNGDAAPSTVLSSNGVQVNQKPPNVLVYADSVIAKDNVKNVLHEILNTHKYMVYDFPTNANSSLWADTACLIVVCGNVPPNISTQFLQYLINGGKLLFREHELVRFSYENWKRVKMMHHVFCYQASPAKRQFSKDSDQSNSSRGSSPVAPRTPSTVEIQHNGKVYTVQVQVLGAEETWHTPSLLLAAVKGTKGIAIFSQVHLEIDPTQYQDDESKFSALTDSNTARLEILKHLLSQHLSLDCTSTSDVSYVPAYFLGMHNLKLELLSECEGIKDNCLIAEKITMKFVGKGVEPETATATTMPVLIHACPSNFSTVKYFGTLNTNSIGRLVVYSDVVTSTQFVVANKLAHGFAVIARQQTQGVGRSSNTWLSPLGCAMFSLQLHVPLQTTLGRSLPLVQHLVMIAVVAAVRRKPGYEDIELGLKWPNDLYANRTIKIGGLLVNTTVYGDMAVVSIGCGVNLDNFEPTTCINELIKNHNVALEPIEYEEYFAIVFNEIESIYNLVQGGDLDLLFELYYKYWLHSGAEVSVNTSDGRTSSANIIGIDDYGYLKVRLLDGSISSVQPDGNSFDLLKGLIAPKTF